MIGLLGEALQCPSVSELHLNPAKIVLDSLSPEYCILRLGHQQHLLSRNFSGGGLIPRPSRVQTGPPASLPHRFQELCPEHLILCGPRTATISDCEKGPLQLTF